MEIAVYGGAFNPPTRAHEAVTRACLEKEDIDEVWLMPSGDRMDKQFGLRDTDRRWMLEYMIEEMFDNDPRLRVSRFELDYIPRPTQTYKTVEALQKYHPEHTFHFVFGADSYQGMPNWQNGHQLQRELGMLIVPRGSYEIEPTKNVTILNVPTCEVLSSTEVRNRVAAGLSIDHMVCSGVARYIRNCKLYR